MTQLPLCRAVAGAAALVVASCAGLASAEPADRERPAGPPLLGKYGCAESVYSGDSFRSEARGFVTLLAGGRYRQGKGAMGRYAYKVGVTRFTGGGLGGSRATGIDAKRDRLLITVRFNDRTTARWACTRVGPR